MKLSKFPRRFYAQFGSLITVLLLLPHSALAEPAKQFELSGINGTTVSLEALRGKVVYLDFWASWCGPCRASFPWMDEMQSKYAEQGLTVLAINLDDKQQNAEEFLEDYPVDFLLAFDPKGTTPKEYGVMGMPTSFLIDRNGEITQQHVGFNSSNKKELEQAIAAQLEKNK